jgi:hypothetical protein
MARCSTVSFGVCSRVEVVETSVSISRSSWVGRVRPPVIAYGRTRRGSGTGCSAELVMAVPHVAGRSRLPGPPAAGFMPELDDDDP